MLKFNERLHLIESSVLLVGKQNCTTVFCVCTGVGASVSVFVCVSAWRVEANAVMVGFARNWMCDLLICKY